MFFENCAFQDAAFIWKDETKVDFERVWFGSTRKSKYLHEPGVDDRLSTAWGVSDFQNASLVGTKTNNPSSCHSPADPCSDGAPYALTQIRS
jgi:hypothetical protein